MDTSQCAVNVSSSGFNILDSSYLDLKIQVHPSSCQLSIWQKIDWPFSIFDFILYLQHGSIILSKSGSRWLVCRALSHNLESLNINIAAQSSSLPLIWSVSSHFPIFQTDPCSTAPVPLIMPGPGCQHLPARHQGRDQVQLRLGGGRGRRHRHRRPRGGAGGRGRVHLGRVRVPHRLHQGEH